MYMVSKSTLNIFRSLAEVRPKDFKIAQIDKEYVMQLILICAKKTLLVFIL